MIPYAQVRSAKRFQVEGMIAEKPAAARFCRSAENGGGNLVLSVRAAEPMKFREMKLGGFDPRVELNALIALPLTAKRPQPEKEFIEIEDLGGEWRRYAIKEATALEGTNCYVLGLASRNAAATTTRPPRPY